MKNYTDIEQSKKLGEILSLESADHHYVRQVRDSTGEPVDRKWSTPKYGNPNSSYAIYIVQNFSSYEKIPCWSLAALLDVLHINLNTSSNGKWIAMIPRDGEMRYEYNDNPIDACFELIIKLKEMDLL